LAALDSLVTDRHLTDPAALRERLSALVEGVAHADLEAWAVDKPNLSDSTIPSRTARRPTGPRS
jgi:hypothetical protein